MEVGSWVVAGGGPVPWGEDKQEAPVPSRPKPTRHRRVLDPIDGEFREVPIYYRRNLAPGAEISGPAVIVEDETSTVVSPRFDAVVDGFGDIQLLRRGGGW